MSRPTKYSKELAELICERIELGESFYDIEADRDFPSRSTLQLWVRTNHSFSHQVACAREASGHALREKARAAAVDARNDWMERLGREGQPIGWQINGDAVQRSKLVMEQYWREAEALQPKVYGKRQTVEHAGQIGVAIVNVSDDDLVAEIMELVMTGRLKPPNGVQFEEREDTELDEDDFSDIAAARADDPYGVG